MRNPFKRKKEPEVAQSLPSFPEKVYIEKGKDTIEYTIDAPAHIERFNDLLNGYYGTQNYLTLFHCLPEVFAPIHEIASRVADANWQLVKDWNDEVDYKDETFNKLFSEPNPLQSFKEFIYVAVVYEILTGATFFYANKPDEELMDLGSHYKNVLTWWNLASHCVQAVQNKNVDPYTITEISDLVARWEETNYWTGGKKVFPTENVMPIIHRSLAKPFDLNCRKAMIAGAEKPIKNLLPVYDARGTIYIKQGALGFVVSAKTDQSGTVALTPKERKELRREHQKDYGITGGRDTVGISDQPIDFVRTGMSIQELEPFEETLANAVAIYGVLRVPRHLVPSKDNSTFANAAADMKAFYADTIIPWANKYAQVFTNFFKIPRRYIKADFSHIPHLQEDKQLTSTSNNLDGETWLERFKSGVCSLNDWITAIDGNKGIGGVFEKKLPEMTPEELDQVKAFMNMSPVSTATANQQESGQQKRDKMEQQSLVRQLNTIIQQLNAIQNGNGKKS